MERTFIVNNTEYTVEEITAVAACNEGNEDYRQSALLVTSMYGPEKIEEVVFGFDMPESDEDFAQMCSESDAWDSDYEVLETVRR